MSEEIATSDDERHRCVTDPCQHWIKWGGAFRSVPEPRDLRPHRFLPSKSMLDGLNQRPLPDPHEGVQSAPGDRVCAVGDPGLSTIAVPRNRDDISCDAVTTVPRSHDCDPHMSSLRSRSVSSCWTADKASGSRLGASLAPRHPRRRDCPHSRPRPGGDLGSPLPRQGTHFRSRGRRCFSSTRRSARRPRRSRFSFSGQGSGQGDAVPMHEEHPEAAGTPPNSPYGRPISR